MAKIDGKLNELYSYICNYAESNGFPPTVRDICRDLGIKSTATAQYYVNKLIGQGLLNKPSDKKRAISVVKKISATSTAIPLLGTVTAGVPIFAVENFDGYYPVSEEFGDGGDLFMLRVKGDSMQNAGILNGDKIIVKKQETAENGEIVVALIDDSATVKRFFKKNGKIILHPENEAYSDIILDDVIVLGTVQGLTRKF